MCRPLKALPLILMLALALLGFVTTSCGNGGSTKIRVVHAMSNDPGNNLDVDVNGTKIAPAVVYGSVYPSQPGGGPAAYIGVPSGSDTIAVFNLNQTTNPVIANTTLNLSGGTDYTVVLGGSLGDIPNPPTAYLFTDNNAAPPTGKVGFRVINASVVTPQSGWNVFIYPSGTQIPATPTISGLLLGQDGPGYIYLTQETSYAITVAYATGTQVFTQNYAQTTGQVSTLVIKDFPTGSGVEQFIEMEDVQ